MGLVFATGPVHLDEDGDDLRAELGAALSEAIGETIVLQAERTYTALLDRVLARTCTIAWVPPALFVRAHTAGALLAVSRAERFASGSYQGALFVREDAPFSDAASLRGARVAWVDRDSCAGYLFPRLALRTAGIDPDDCFSAESFVLSHSRVVRAVATGAADVGATYVQLADAGDPAKGIAVAGWTAFADAHAMRAVSISASIPSDAVCIGAHVEPAVAESIRSGLSGFHSRPNGARLLRAMLNADRLVPGAPEDYAPVRAALVAEGLIA